MNKGFMLISVIVVSAGAVVFFSLRQGKVASEKSDPSNARPIAIEQSNNQIAMPQAAQQTANVPNDAGIVAEPKIEVGSKVKLKYQVKNFETNAVIAETGKNQLPTEFIIGTESVFGELLLRLVGAQKGASIEFTLPPNIGIQSAAGQEFARNYGVQSDTTLKIQMTVEEILSK